MQDYSVLMSLYKKETPDFLTQAIDSMLAQTALPQEIVVVKDGPLTNELETVLNGYVKKHPTLFTIVTNEKNIGLGLALNEGLKVCRNELVARMDTDDISKPDRCVKQLSVFESDPDISICGAWAAEFENNTSNIISIRKVPYAHDDIYKFSKRRSAFNHPAVMFRKSAVLGVGGYANLRRNQDVDLFGRMMFAGAKAKNIPESLLYYRVNEALTKRRKSWENSKSYINTIWNFKKIGFSSWSDYMIVAAAQTLMYLCPTKLQKWLYKTFLRN